jgi:HSP20 family protein
MIFFIRLQPFCPGSRSGSGRCNQNGRYVTALAALREQREIFSNNAKLPLGVRAKIAAPSWHSTCGIEITKPIKEEGVMAEKNKEPETKAIAPRRPLVDLARWERDMERMFDDFWGRRMRPWWPERWSMPAALEISPPAVDLYEEKDEIVVKAELPGMDKDNIEVNLSDHSLTIKGEKKKEEETKEENYYKSERSYGSFVRSIELPIEVQSDKVKATFKNGVLEVRLPKSEQAKAKEIKVKVD